LIYIDILQAWNPVKRMKGALNAQQRLFAFV